MTTAPKTTKSRATTKRTPKKPQTVATPPPVTQEATVTLKKKDLIAAVVEATGARRGEVKGAVEATLAVLGREVMAGRSVQTPELGRLKVVKQKDTGTGSVVVCRLRGPKPKTSDAQ